MGPSRLVPPLHRACLTKLRPRAASLLSPGFWTKFSELTRFRWSSRTEVRSFAMATAFSKIPTPPPVLSDAEDAHWDCVPATPSTPKHYVYSKPIQKSQQDDREYRVIRLENGLEAVLVHDAHADKSAASLDVAVGHLSDPVSSCAVSVRCLVPWLCSLRPHPFR